MRIVRSGSIALALTLATTLGQAEPPTGEGDVSGYSATLPGAGRKGVAATVVVDGETGRPLVGAEVLGYPEDIDTRHFDYGTAVVEAKTDAQGVASFRLDDGDVGHWVVRASGYAPLHQFGWFPPEVSALERGRDLRFRLVDEAAAPVANAAVDAYAGDGCPHAPTLWTGTTDANGIATITNADRQGVNLWIRATGFVVHRTSVMGLLGTTPEELVLERAVTCKGTVRGPDGAPLVGAVVRSDDFPRGPATTTDREGRFELAGLAADAGVVIVHPDRPGSEEDTKHTIDRTTADHPLDVTWTPTGFAEPTKRGTIEVRTSVPESMRDEDVPFEIVGSNGLPEFHELEWDEEKGAHVGSFEVAVGTAALRAAGPIGPFGIVTQTAVVEASKTTRVALSSFPRVPVRLIEPPADLDLDQGVISLFVGGATRHLSLGDDWKSRDAVAFIDSDVPALVRITSKRFGRSEADVGPVREGARAVPLRWTPIRATHVRVVPGSEVDDVSIFVDAERDIAATVERLPGGVVRTQATGPLWVLVRSDKKEHVFPIDASDSGPAAEFVLDLASPLAKEVPSGFAELTLVRADGKPLPPLDVTATRMHMRGTTSPIELGTPSLVRIDGQGLVSRSVRVTAPGPRQLVIPAGTVRATVLDWEGQPAVVRTLLDGTLGESTKDGIVEFAGLAAGEHSLVVSPATGSGLLWRFTLADGETKARVLNVPLDVEEELTGRTLPGAKSESEASTFVLDAVTLEPIAGARVRWYPELAADTDIEHGWVFDEGVSDPYGIAVVRLHKDWAYDKHWVAFAEGYVPTYEYGVRPPERMEMRRGKPCLGRVRDAFGKPIAGLTLEYMFGCGHGPGIEWPRTDAEGRFRIENVPYDTPSFTYPRLWIVAPGCRATNVALEGPDLGARPRDIVLPPGATARGTILDITGRPLGGVVVRQFVETRGPATTTTPDGTFVLHGCDAGDELTLYHPAEWGRLSVPFVEDRPVTIRLGIIEPERPEPDATLIVRVLDRDGRAVPSATYLRAVGDDGYVEDAGTEETDVVKDDDAVRVGEARLRVPAGSYEIRSDGPFGRVEIVRARVTAVRGHVGRIDVTAVPCPRLVVEGAGDERASIHCGGFETDASDDTCLPPQAPAVANIGDRWVTVGPVDADGARHVDFRTLRRHRVRWPAGLAVENAELRYDHRAVLAQRDGDSLVTQAAGPLVLRLHTKAAPVGADYDVTLPVDDGAAIDVIVDPATAKKSTSERGARISLLRPTDRGDRVLDIAATDFHNDHYETMTWPDNDRLDVPFRRGVVRIGADDLAPIRLYLGDIDAPAAEWGTASLTLTVVGRDDSAIAATVLLDGKEFNVGTDGRLDVHGLLAGAHQALVLSEDRTHAKAWRFSIAARQRLEKRVRIFGP